MVELEDKATVKRSRTISDTSFEKGERYDYNTVKYQEDNPKIETCGDHVCHFLYCFLKLDMDLGKHKEYMNKLRKEMDQSYDSVVASFIQNVLRLDVK